MFVGGLIGLSLHYLSTFFISILDLETRHEESRGRTLSSYRAQKHVRREQGNPMRKNEPQNDLPQSVAMFNGGHSAWERVMNAQAKTGSRSVPNTILEEDSIDDDSY